MNVNPVLIHVLRATLLRALMATLKVRVGANNQSNDAIAAFVVPCSQVLAVSGNISVPMEKKNTKHSVGMKTAWL